MANSGDYLKEVRSVEAVTEAVSELWPGAVILMLAEVVPLTMPVPWTAKKVWLTVALNLAEAVLPW